MNISEINSILKAEVQEKFWVVSFRSLLVEPDAHVSSENLGKSTVKQVLADARIHCDTTARAGITAIGFDDLISRLEDRPSQDEVFIVGVVASIHRGVLYLASSKAVIGGVVLKKNKTWRS